MANRVENQRSIPIVEDVDKAHVIEALMKNYTSAQSAFMELIDNAVDNRIHGQQSRITIRANQVELFVGNMGGRGLDLPGLQSYFIWGSSEKRDQKDQIGQYGIGGKAAMGYLGRSFILRCSAEGAREQYSVIERDFTRRDPGKEKVFEAKEEEAIDQEKGYFNITIKNLNKRLGEQALIKRLSKEYRPLLIPQDGNPPEIFMTVGKQRVLPQEIPYVTDDPELQAQTYKLSDVLENEYIMSVGVLQSTSDEVEPGINCYYRGKLIKEGAFFGIPREISGANRLTGEIHLDHVPVIMNKTGFDEDSEAWKAASAQVEQFLKREWLEKLKKLKSERRYEPTREEITLAQRLKVDFDNFLSSTGFLTNYELPGSASGRLPTVNPGVVRPTPNGNHASPEGKTPPSPGAVEGKGKVKRWGALHNWEPRSLGNSRQRATVIEADNRRVLHINTDFLAYQKAKRAGEPALDQYMVDTIAMELGKQIKPESVEEYYEFVNEMVRGFTEYRDAEKTKGGDIFVSPKKGK